MVKFISILSKTILFYLLSFSAFCIILIITNHFDLLTESCFLNWDAAHYEYIKNNGYNDFRTAFFPLFPFLWKILNTGALGISIVNGLLFVITISYIVYNWNIDFKTHLILLSVPSLFFMFIPYSESLFFLFGTIILIGLYKDNISLVCFGLFICGIIRPTAFVFIPAIIITEFLTKKNVLDFVKRSLFYSLTTLLGLFITVYIHFLYTNKWFVFFEAQKLWDNKLRIPHLPFTSWGGDNITRLDGTALVVGLIAIFFLFKLVKHLIQSGPNLIISKPLLFSSLYLAGTTLIVLFFRGGSLFSLNRFIYASPFFIFSFSFFLNNFKIKLKNIGFLFILFSLFWLLFNSYVHIQALLKYEILTIITLLPFLMVETKYKNLKCISYYSFLIITVSLQLYFLYSFLNQGWIG